MRAITRSGAESRGGTGAALALIALLAIAALPAPALAFTFSPNRIRIPK